jgi:hypothetical protein
MARKSRPTFKKRQKEIARQQRARDKMSRRLDKKDQPPEPTLGLSDEDPDIAGINPGPQPLPEEWSYLPNAPREQKENSTEEKKSEPSKATPDPQTAG